MAFLLTKSDKIVVISIKKQLKIFYIKISKLSRESDVINTNKSNLVKRY